MMKRRLPAMIVCAVVLFLAPACAWGTAPAVPDSTVSTVFLVRHAEKNPHPAGGDAGLSTIGLLRARQLARVLGDAGVSAVYTSQFGRARMTGESLARAIGDSVRVYDANHLEDLARRVRSEGRGRAVLIVGHGDTIGPTIEALTDTALGKDEPAPYDRMWILTLREGGAWHLVRLRYGALSAP
jgi:broad specificity phosphatase PhoE